MQRETAAYSPPQVAAGRAPAARSITRVSDRTSEWETYVGYGPAARTLFYVVPGLLGAGLGVALHFVLDWLLGLPWLPRPVGPEQLEA